MTRPYTRDVPTLPGFYWTKHNKSAAEEVAEIRITMNGWEFCRALTTPSGPPVLPGRTYSDGRWFSGPLARPTLHGGPDGHDN